MPADVIEELRVDLEASMLTSNPEEGSDLKETLLTKEKASTNYTNSEPDVD